jgi:transcriptional regulator GlxA family with amidase domain
MFEEIPLLEIAINAGFYDQSHFSNCFKKYVGLAPDKYRQVCNILQDKGNRLT